MQAHSIAIIGAGFSGTLLSLQLLRHCSPSTRISLIEQAPGFATGLAYATTCAEHRLNVPAGKMSAFPDRPNDFTGISGSSARQRSGWNDSGRRQFCSTATLWPLSAEPVDGRHAELSSGPPGTGTWRDAGDYPGANRPDGSSRRRPCHRSFHSGHRDRQRDTVRSLSGFVRIAVLSTQSMGKRRRGRSRCRCHGTADRYRADHDRHGSAVAGQGHRGLIHALSRRGLLPHTHAQASQLGASLQSARNPAPAVRPCGFHPAQSSASDRGRRFMACGG